MRPSQHAKQSRQRARVWPHQENKARCLFHLRRLEERTAKGAKEAREHMGAFCSRPAGCSWRLALTQEAGSRASERKKIVACLFGGRILGWRAKCIAADANTQQATVVWRTIFKKTGDRRKRAGNAN